MDGELCFANHTRMVSSEPREPLLQRQGSHPRQGEGEVEGRCLGQDHPSQGSPERHKDEGSSPLFDHATQQAEIPTPP